MTTEKKEFYSKICRLVLPIVFQNLLSAAISSADVIMLNYVGQTSVSAVSQAAQYANILFSLLYGVGTGVTMLCAQYYGKKDFEAIKIVQGIAMRFSLAGGLIVAVPALLVPEIMMKIFIDNPEAIRIGADYLRFMSVSYICWSIIEVYLSALRSVGRVTICTVMNVIAFCVNVFLNAVFIFGLFGAPKLGAAGVAIATSTARVIELICCMIVSAYSKDVKMSLLSIFTKNKVLLGDFVRLSLPALGNDIIWGLALTTMPYTLLLHKNISLFSKNSLHAAFSSEMYLHHPLSETIRGTPFFFPAQSNPSAKEAFPHIELQRRPVCLT